LTGPVSGSVTGPVSGSVTGAMSGSMSGAVCGAVSAACRLLVFGRSGQVARCLQRAPLPQGWSLTALSREQADLSDPVAIRRTVNAGAWSVIINAAAYTAVDRAEHEPALAFAVNRDGPAEIAAAASARDIPLVHLSTDYVFAGDKAGAYREDDPIGPLGVYGRSKAEGESAVLSCHPRSVILRTAWVFSPFGHNFVKTMIRLAAERDSLSVVDDQIGCPTAAADIAAAILAIVPGLIGAAAHGNRYGLFHVVGRGETSWFGFASAIMAELAARGRAVPNVLPIPTASYPTPARRPANSVLDCDRFDRVFGIRRRHWREALAECMAVLIPTRL